MCDPTTIAVAGLLLSTASAATAYAGQKSAANNQRSYQTSVQDAQNAAYLQQATALRQQQNLEAEAAARESQKVAKQTKETLATVRTAAGEAGVSGISVDALVQDFERNSYSQMEAIDRQKQLGDVSITNQLEAARLGTYNANVGSNSPISRPSFLSTALQIGTGAVNSASTYYQLKGSQKNPDKKG